MTPRHPRRQRGAAALGITLMLLFALALVVGMVHRTLLLEQRASANQLRSTRAFEAAEAGLEWAQALLNRTGAIDANCAAADATPADMSFRDRYLAWDAATARFAPRTWNGPSGAQSLKAACVAGESGWDCSCPADAAPALHEPEDSVARPAFVVEFVAAPRSGMVQLVATGCDRVGPACLAVPTGAPAGDAVARVQATLALLPALAGLPAAALTARGAIAVDGGIALANEDPATEGVAARAGGAIALPQAQIETLPGRGPGEALVAQAPALEQIEAERLLTRLLGADRARWQQLPGVRRIDCDGDCARPLAEATAPRRGGAMFWIEGDFALEGPLTLGTPDRPVLLVVSGNLRWQGEVVVHGAVVTLAPTWDTGGAAAAQVRGAWIALGDVTGTGAPRLVRDRAVLARLHGEIGHFARVAGSWRDF